MSPSTPRDLSRDLSPDATHGPLHGEHHRRERTQALLAAFRVFGARWPRFFGATRLDDLLPIWLPAVTGIDAAQLEPIAVAYAAEAEGPAPAPAEFGRWARAYLRRVTGGDRMAAAPRQPDPSRLHGARPFWYAKRGPDKGPGRLDADRALALATPEGCHGISDPELERLWTRELAGGWLAPEDVPTWAVPAGWHASHGVRVAA